MSAQKERVYLSRSEEVRCSNEHIAERAAQLHFVSRVPMLCECSDPNCQTIVLISLDRWEELRGSGFLTAPNHRIGHATLAARDDGYWLQRPTTPPTPGSNLNG